MRHTFASEPQSLVRARWGCILLVTCLVVAGALGAVKKEHKSYKSSASVVVGPQVFADGAEPLPADLGTAKDLATSTLVLARAGRALSVSPTVLHKGISITNPADTSVLVFTYTSPDPKVARRRAETIANAFCAYQNASLVAVTRQVKMVAAGGKSNSSLSVEQSKIITPAELPTSPSGHSLVLDTIVALIAGLGLGLGAALVLDRCSDRLRRPADIQAQLVKPVLAEIVLPARLSIKGDPLEAIRNTPGLVGAYRSLRVRLQDLTTEATARWEPTARGEPTAPGAEPRLRAEPGHLAAQRGVTVVASPTRRSAPGVPVALGLALSMASSGKRVVLVGADLGAGSIGALFGVADAPGLAEALSGRATAESLLLETSQPNLSVLSEGVARAQAEDLFDQARCGALFWALRLAGYEVVVDGLALLESPESRTLVASATTVVLNVDMSRVGRAELRESASVLAGHDDSFAGAVISRARHFGHPRVRVGAQGVFARPFQPIDSAASAQATAAVPVRSAGSGHIAALSSLVSHASWSRPANEASGERWREADRERAGGASAMRPPSL